MYVVHTLKNDLNKDRRSRRSGTCRPDTGITSRSVPGKVWFDEPFRPGTPERVVSRQVSFYSGG